MDRRWPPPVKAPAGSALPGPTRDDNPAGRRQEVTSRFPIDLYAGEQTPGQDTGNGVQGSWHIIKINTTTAAATGLAKALKATRTRSRGRSAAVAAWTSVLLQRGTSRHSGKSA